MLWLEAFYFLAPQTSFDQLFNLLQLYDLISTDQRQCATCLSRAASSPDAVHVILRHVGQIKVHHHGQLRYVDTAGSDIGGYKHLHVATFELL